MSQNGHTSHVSRLHPTASAAGGSLGMLGHNPRSTAVNNRNNSNMNHTSSSPAAASWNASQVDANQNNVAGLATTHHHPGAAPGTPSGGDYETKETVHPSPESSSSSQSGTTLKEHDLLGLSDVSSSVTRQENSAQDSSFQSEEINLNLNLGATELRLGLQDARKMLDSEFQRQRSGVVGTPEQGTSSASETGNFLGGLDGGGKGADQGALVSDRRSSNSDQYTSISEQQQQQVLERRFSYGPLTGERGPPTPQGGRADVLEGTVCKPLIESESLQKWHGGLERNMVSNESLRLGMSLPLSKRALNQEDVTEQLFFNSADRNYQDNTTQEVKQHQHQLVEEHHHPLGYQDRSWQERNQHNLGQEDVSSTERAGTQERPMSDRVPPPLDQQQQVGEKGEQQDRLKHEPFHTEKRNLQEGNKTLAAPQQPEPRFVQELSSALPERSPRHSSDYGQKLWQSQVLRPAEFHTQQQMPSHPAQQEDSSRTGYPGPLVGGFPGPGSRVSFGPSKPGVSGAKRSFDTIGISSDARNFNDARAGLPSPVTGTSAVIPSNTSSSDADVKSKSQQPPLYQSWGTKATPPWQMLQHSGGSFGPFPSQAPGRNPAMPVMNNHPTAEAASAGGDPAQKAWEAQTKSLQEPAASSLPQKMSTCPSETKPVAAQASSPATEAVSAPRATAPPANAVGWPPLRSFRKSTLASQNRPSPVETNPRPPPPSSTQAASPASVASQPNSYFVKVYMDGVPIGRKVDLKAYSSYEKLSLVLEDMFRGFVNGQQSGQGGRDMTAQTDKRSFFRGTDYVLTYEDQEGDLMLVGDVPWMLFLETVKRLRIMKGSEAIGLGSRAGARVAAEKVNKTQHSV